MAGHTVLLDNFSWQAVIWAEPHANAIDAADTQYSNAVGALKASPQSSMAVLNKAYLQASKRQPIT